MEKQLTRLSIVSENAKQSSIQITKCQDEFVNGDVRFRVHVQRTLPFGSYHSNFYEAEMSGNGSYAAKAMRFQSVRDFRLEYLLAYLAGMHGIGPRVHLVNTCSIKNDNRLDSVWGWIIMDKWDGRVLDFLNRNNDMENWKQVVEMVLQMCHKLHMVMNVYYGRNMLKKLVYKYTPDGNIRVGLVGWSQAIPWNHKATDNIEERKDVERSGNAFRVAALDLVQLIYGEVASDTSSPRGLIFVDALVGERDVQKEAKLAHISQTIDRIYFSRMSSTLATAFDIVVAQTRDRRDSATLYDPRPQAVFSRRVDIAAGCVLRYSDPSLLKYMFAPGKKVELGVEDVNSPSKRVFPHYEEESFTRSARLQLQHTVELLKDGDTSEVKAFHNKYNMVFAFTPRFITNNEDEEAALQPDYLIDKALTNVTSFDSVSDMNEDTLFVNTNFRRHTEIFNFVELFTDSNPRIMLEGTLSEQVDVRDFMASTHYGKTNTLLEITRGRVSYKFSIIIERAVQGSNSMVNCNISFPVSTDLGTKMFFRVQKPPYKSS